MNTDGLNALYFWDWALSISEQLQRHGHLETQERKRDRHTDTSMRDKQRKIKGDKNRDRGGKD